MQIIGKTSEWQRINSLPMRDPDIFQNPFPGLTHSQSLLFHELCACQGGIGCIGVGGGKSFVAPLLPFAINAKKPLLIVPAQLKIQTIDHVIPKHQELGLQIHPNLRIETYNWISSIKGADFLEEYQPDLIIADECHKLKNPKAARTKRIMRFFKKYPQTIFVGLSGTITKNSLLDYYHLFFLALRKGSPLPNNYQECELWDLALSPKKDKPFYEMIHPGALLEWNSEPRVGFQNRLRKTSGVIFTEQSQCESSIYIQLMKDQYKSPELTNCRYDWELPNGELICDALEYYQKMRQLALGFYYDYVVQPPDEWSETKRSWQSIARSILKYNRQNIDTLGQLELSPIVQQIPEYHKWKSIEKTYIPQTYARWFDPNIIYELMHALSYQNDWSESLIWTDSVAVGELFKHNGMQYFGSGDDRELLEYIKKPYISAPLVLSINAHSEGKNLQRFNKNIILTPPASGKAWEQIIGRTHRLGQEADEILFYVYLHTPEYEQAFENALDEAKYIQQTTGQKQKLLLATILNP